MHDLEEAKDAGYAEVVISLFHSVQADLIVKEGGRLRYGKLTLLEKLKRLRALAQSLQRQVSRVSQKKC